MHRLKFQINESYLASISSLDDVDSECLRLERDGATGRATRSRSSDERSTMMPVPKARALTDEGPKGLWAKDQRGKGR